MSSPSPTQPTRKLEAALDDFQNSLSTEQKAQLQAFTVTSTGPPTADAVLQFTAQVDAGNSRRKSRCVASRIQGLVGAVQQFSAVVDTFTAANPTAALVWGSIKVFVLAASHLGSFFEDLTTSFMRIQRLCPRYEKYQFLLKESTDLQEALCSFYAALVRFCGRMMIAIRRPGLLHLARTAFSPFQSQFDQVEKELQVTTEEVEKWIRYASDQAANRERSQVARWRTSFNKLSKRDHDWKLSQDERRRRSLQSRLLDKLSDHDYYSALKRMRKKRFQNPHGLWLTTNAQYQEWLGKAQSSVFVLSGKMGSGKSVLSSAVVDALLLEQVPPGSLRTFFFCEHDNAHSLKARTILGCLARQSFPQGDLSETLLGGLKALFDGVSPDEDEIAAFFVQYSNVTRIHYIVIDALDECPEPERNRVFTTLQALLKLEKPSFRIFLSGREDIVPRISQTLRHKYHQTMNCKEVSNDIEIVIDASLREKLQKRDLVLQDATLESEIREALTSGANGMFLWVALMIEDLCAQTCDDDIRSAIHDLPASLPEIYERALTRINKLRQSQSNVAQKMFRWAAAACRPLSLEEMREAIAIEPCQPSFNSGKLVNDVEHMVSWAGNLLTLDEEEDTIQFVHHSVQEYLETECADPRLIRYHFTRQDANRDAGEVCVTYLNFSDFERQISTFSAPKAPLLPISIAKAALPMAWSPALTKSVERLEGTLRSRKRPTFDLKHQLEAISGEMNHTLTTYCLLPYVSEYWLDHTVDLSIEDCHSWPLWTTSVINDKPHATKPWKWTAMRSFSDSSVVQYSIDHNHAALMYLLVKHLPGLALDERQPLSTSDVAYLLRSLKKVSWRKTSWVQLVVRASEDNITSDHYITALSSAPDSWDRRAEKFRPSNVPVIGRTGGVDLVALTPGSEQQYLDGFVLFSRCAERALLAAAEDGDVKRLQFFRRMYHTCSGKEFFYENWADHYSPLYAAAQNGHRNLFAIVLGWYDPTDSHASIVYPEAMGRALELSSVRNELGMVSMVIEMLERSLLLAEPETTEHLTEGLVAASIRGHEAIVEKLLHYIEVVDLNRVSRYIKIDAVTAAVAGSHMGVLKQLLAIDSILENLQSPPVRYATTALHYVTDPDVVDLLVSAGAGLNFSDVIFETPVRHAIKLGRASVAMRFLDHGADPTGTNFANESALHLVSNITDDEAALAAVARLLAAGAHVNWQDVHGRTPLDRCKSRPSLAGAIIRAGGVLGSAKELRNWRSRSSSMFLNVCPS